MIGEQLIRLAYSNQLGELPYLQTNSGSYAFQVGGMKKLEDAPEHFEEIDCPFIGKIIEHVYTDLENVYTLLSDDALITHGSLIIDDNGTTELSLFFDSGEEVLEARQEYAQLIEMEEEYFQEIAF